MVARDPESCVELKAILDHQELHPVQRGHADQHQEAKTTEAATEHSDIACDAAGRPGACRQVWRLLELAGSRQRVAKASGLSAWGIDPTLHGAAVEMRL
ncbi:hypothetical protein HPG69_001728 [Diceros bicornis minor]|uniref:Uncharacterized protein n=1 Tax=Diceros bicornis minor TaxID=77932 RepID=A0A7J7FC43_DICBM|nr:hypothetical protein HPG69_001728 [Diceros bicornis minor]